MGGQLPRSLFRQSKSCQSSLVPSTQLSCNTVCPVTKSYKDTPALQKFFVICTGSWYGLASILRSTLLLIRPSLSNSQPLFRILEMFLMASTQPGPSAYFGLLRGSLVPVLLGFEVPSPSIYIDFKEFILFYIITC